MSNKYIFIMCWAIGIVPYYFLRLDETMKIKDREGFEMYSEAIIKSVHVIFCLIWPIWFVEDCYRFVSGIIFCKS